jgi:hypothetical protein
VLAAGEHSENQFSTWSAGKVACNHYGEAIMKSSLQIDCGLTETTDRTRKTPWAGQHPPRRFLGLAAGAADGRRPQGHPCSSTRGKAALTPRARLTPSPWCFEFVLGEIHQSDRRWWNSSDLAPWREAREVLMNDADTPLPGD